MINQETNKTQNKKMKQSFEKEKNRTLRRKNKINKINKNTKNYI